MNVMFHRVCAGPPIYQKKLVRPASRRTSTVSLLFLSVIAASLSISRASAQGNSSISILSVSATDSTAARPAPASSKAPTVSTTVPLPSSVSIKRIDAKLHRTGQPDPQIDDLYRNYYVLNTNGVDAYLASMRKARPAISVGGQTPTSTTAQDPKTVQKPTAPTAPAAPAPPTSRALPSPIENPPFPFTDWTINSGFPIGENWDASPGTLQHLLFGTKLDNTHWRIGGWADGGTVISNAKNSNLPDTYELVPNKLELDQLILSASKAVDTTQKRYVDWGFYCAELYGIDYRFTTATGYFSDQLSHRNSLYGFDPVLNWGEVYLPKVADGTVIQFGRYISPIDIEAQLSNSNYLYSHSLMFGVDPYTYTGINAQVRVNKEFEYMIGIHAGNENSPWSGACNANLEALIGWSSADNKDSLWGGLDSWTPSGKAIRGHDDEQIVNFVWGHVFNQRLHMQTQVYYMWEWDALVGGTPITGPSQPFASSGAGAPIPGKAYAFGYVNNLEYKVNKNDYISFRDGFLSDPQGWRTGVATDYSDITLGYSHLFARNFWLRPEVRYDHSYGAPSWDNGTLQNLYSFGCDLIMRF